MITTARPLPRRATAPGTPATSRRKEDISHSTRKDRPPQTLTTEPQSPPHSTKETTNGANVLPPITRPPQHPLKQDTKTQGAQQPGTSRRHDKFKATPKNHRAQPRARPKQPRPKPPHPQDATTNRSVTQFANGLAKSQNTLRATDRKNMTATETAPTAARPQVQPRQLADRLRPSCVQHLTNLPAIETRPNQPSTTTRAICRQQSRTHR